MENLLPKWQKELEMYLGLRSSIILDGNIYDKHPRQLKEGTINYEDTEEYLFNFLLDQGYKVVVFFNHVDGIYNRIDTSHIEKFEIICEKQRLKQRGENIENEKDDFVNLLKGLTSTTVSKIDNSKFGDMVPLIRFALNNDEEPVAVVMGLASRYKAGTENNITETESLVFSQLLLAASSKPIRHGVSKDGKNIYINNVMLLLSDNIRDLPNWFFHNKPFTKSIFLPNPDIEARHLYSKTKMESFYGIKDLKAKGFNDTLEDLKKEILNIKDRISKKTTKDLIENSRITKLCDLLDISSERVGKELNLESLNEIENKLNSLISESKTSSFNFNKYQAVENILKKYEEMFVDLTDSFKNKDLESLNDLMKSQKIPFHNLKEAINLYKFGIKTNPWDNELIINKLPTLKEDLSERVIGQEEAVNKVVQIVKRAAYGLSGLQHSSSKAKPRGIMFFGGPTGVGKTELAKALAETLFGSEDNFIRFDMSEFRQPHSDQRLFGAPPGYVGYDAGGELTNKVREKPFSIILFDEIEKADRSILDKFLQILEDGRMTDGRGQTVYFSDAVLLFTSNMGMKKRSISKGVRDSVEVSEDVVTFKEYGNEGNFDEYRNKVLTQIQDDFKREPINRPELLNRIGDNILIFRYISDKVALKIGTKVISKIVKNLYEAKKISLHVSDKVISKIVESRDKAMGGRGVTNAVESSFLNPLTSIIEANMGKDKISIIDVEIKGGSAELITL
jgi:SpoVK/Ycf46/Vps4 family AAA+-type ATPase